MTMGEIIEGVQFQIEANELEELLTKKTNHHAKKYEQYTLQYENMQRDKLLAAFEKMVHHRSEMKKYDYLRRHVIAGAKYRVTYSDLSRLIV